MRDPGEFAVRGGLVDLFPPGEEQALRLDFFGDEIESVRRFDPATQRSIDRIDGFTLLPASETLLDEDSVKRFRSAYRELFGANATGDPLYQAVSDGRRIAGIDHWLPLFEERLATLFDHLADDDLIVRDAGDAGAAEARFEAVADYYENRDARADQGGRQLPPARARDALSRRARNGTALVAARPLHLRRPRSTSRKAPRSSISASTPARDFAPERAQGDQCLRSGGRPCRRAAAGEAQGRARQLFARARASG